MSCPNLNHRNAAASVRFCPSCGEVVNPRILLKRNCRSDHARRRRERSTYCIDCGEQLCLETNPPARR